MSDKTHVKKLKPHHQVSLDHAVVKVGAKWCKACRESAESYEKMAKKYDKIDFYDVDADRFDKEKSMMKDINKIVKKTSAMPTFYFFRKGKIVGSVEGYSTSKFKMYLAAIEA